MPNLFFVRVSLVFPLDVLSLVGALLLNGLEDRLVVDDAVVRQEDLVVDVADVNLLPVDRRLENVDQLRDQLVRIDGGKNSGANFDARNFLGPGFEPLTEQLDDFVGIGAREDLLRVESQVSDQQGPEVLVGLVDYRVVAGEDKALGLKMKLHQ